MLILKESMLQYIASVGIVFLILNSGAGTLSTLYFIAKHHEELDCDHLLDGIILGFIALLVLVMTLINYLCNCCITTCSCKFLGLISSLGILSSTFYNVYLYYERSDNCQETYEKHDLEKYYNYYLICLLINSFLILCVIFGYFCCK